MFEAAYVVSYGEMAGAICWRGEDGGVGCRCVGWKFGLDGVLPHRNLG